MVPAEVLQCVAFIGCWVDDGNGGKKFEVKGSAFFVGLGVSDDGRSERVLLVTARHNLTKLQALGHTQIGVRLNGANGFLYVRSTLNDWWQHSAKDIALMERGIPNYVSHKAIPDHMFLDIHRLANMDAELGWEVFIAGLLWNRPGSNRNIPTVRVGHVASFDVGEPVPTRLGPMTAFLIQIPSIGGVSGAPVFLRPPLHRFRNGTVETYTSGGLFYFLGLVHGHYDEEFPRNSDVVALNTGIAVVVPAEHVRDAIDQYFRSGHKHTATLGSGPA